MTERPILFNGEMVRAILAGRKTQTRRVVKGNAPFRNEHGELEWYPAGEKEGYHAYNGPSSRFAVPSGWAAHWCPHGAPGDTLWVRETLAALDCPPSLCAAYLADASYVRRDGKLVPWGELSTRKIPSIHMPRWACRIVLTVTGVRVERVQDITWQDALSEGVEAEYCCDGYDCGCRGLPIDNPTGEFRILWDSINAKRGYGWDANPCDR